MPATYTMPTNGIFVAQARQWLEEELGLNELAYQEPDRVTSARAHRVPRRPEWAYIGEVESQVPTKPKKKLSAFSILVDKEKEINSK